MEKLQFNTIINAPREKVWEVLWGDESYPAWTSVFSEDSQVQTDNWRKGSKVLFGDGSGNGMVSMVHDNIPNEFMSFKHLGEIKGGVEDTESERVKAWAGAFENYTLKTVDDKTELQVDLDMNDEFKEYFETAFPKALAKVKELAEKN